MAAGDIQFAQGDGFVAGVDSSVSSITFSAKIDAEEASLGKLTIGISASDTGKEPCKFCTKEQSALVFTVGTEKHGFCARCIVMIFTMVNATASKKPDENELRVPCDGCGYQIQPNHGTKFQGKTSTKFLCDRCFDSLADILEERREPRKNILA